MDREPVGMRHAHVDESDIPVHQVGDEGDVAGRAIEACNQKDGAALSAFRDCGEQLGPIGVFLPALHFDELRDDLSTALDIFADSFALRVHPEARDALFVGGHAVVRAETVNHAIQKSVGRKCPRRRSASSKPENRCNATLKLNCSAVQCFAPQIGGAKSRLRED